MILRAIPLTDFDFLHSPQFRIPDDDVVVELTGPVDDYRSYLPLYLY